MRILHLISQRPDSTGSGTYIQEIMREAAASGATNLLIAGIQTGERPEVKYVDRQHQYFVEFGLTGSLSTIVGMSDVMPYPSLRFRDLSEEQLKNYERQFASSLNRVVNDHKPDIIHSHHLWLVSALAATLYPDIPLVTSCHGSDLRQFRTCPHLQKRVVQGCRHISAVFALSPPQRDEIIQLYDLRKEKIQVVGAGFNPQLFYQERKPFPDPVRLLYAGKLSNAKGVPYLLQALAQIQEPYHLDLVGGGAGTEFEHCLQLGNRLAGQVTLHGPLPQQQLASLMRAAHIMILPSLYEGLPLIVLEALASGCRVICTDLPGTRIIKQALPCDHLQLIPAPGGHGVEVLLEQDQKRFTTAITAAVNQALGAARLQHDVELSHIEKGLKSFSWPAVYRKIESVYQKAIDSFL